MAGDRPGFLRVFNPAIYLVSVLPGIGVWLLATQRDAQQLLWLVLATVAVVLLQHTINLLNDVSDWKLGADSEKYDSWVRFHHHDTRVASMHGWISFVLGGVLGIAGIIQGQDLWIRIALLS